MSTRDPIFRETTTRFGVLRLDVEVADDVLAIRLTPVQRSSMHLPLGEVIDARVTDYSPREHGGWHWGVRSSLRGTTMCRLRGRRGVSLTMSDGRRVFVGSEHPHELCNALGHGAR